ncbi:MAG: hypothetical protein AAF480_11385 [Actinomycetota bacterium]
MVASNIHLDPVFWWWEESGGSRVVLLTDALLILSGPLADDKVVELEEARRGGSVESADFGSDATRIAIGAIESLRYVPDAHRLELELAGAGTFVVEPPRSNAGIALGVFDTLAKRLAPDRTPVDSHIDGPAQAEDPTLTVVGAMIVLGLVCLGLAVASDQAAPTGPLSGLRTTLNDVFDRVGYLPALVLFAIAAAVQVHRMRRPDADDSATTPTSSRVLELDLRGIARAETAPAESETAEPLDVVEPEDPPADVEEVDGPAWTPPETDAVWGQDTETEQPSGAEEAWAPPTTDAAWGEPESEGSVAPSHADAVGDSLDADAGTHSADPADVEAEFWSQGRKAPAAEPWWDAAPDADGDQDVLPPPPPPVDHGTVVEAAVIEPEPAVEPEPVAAEAAPSWEPEPVADEPAPSWEPEPVADEPAPSWEPEPVADEPAPSWEPEPVADEPAPSWEPEPVAEAVAVEADEVAPPWEPEPTVAPAAAVAPDSPFADILDREAPMPAWASAPEPEADVVAPAAMARSVRASLRPEPAEVD